MTEVDPATGRVAAATLPAGAKDVLPVEAQELGEVERALRGAFAAFGYREVRTPVLEFADVVDRAQEDVLRDAFRLFDDGGRVLVLRPDLTIPVARLVATRMADHPGPVRVCYVASAFRPPAPGRPRATEQRQAGVELVGEGSPSGDAEALALLVGALRAAGLRELRVGVGDVALTRAVLDGLGVAPERREALQAALTVRNLVEWRRLAREALGDGAASRLLCELPTMRGGRALAERIGAEVPASAAECERLATLLDQLDAHGVGDAVLLDLGVLRDWRYYSGVVFEAFAPGVAAPVAMGGRYDGLAGRFGRPRPAVGFAIALDLLHGALVAAGAPAPGPRAGVVLEGGLDRDLAAAAAARRAGIPVVALGGGADAGDADALAAADGWRWVARPSGDGYRVVDRVTGDARDCARLEEVLASPA
ncbi:ATP phosphoribosyltransferase regulatory subunit [Miltoncostaea marina]|uniref:ATP phosphoribosyltransferase regulatory subunit n=1 Tax=Miltoncostaea marina TaxID=2843215 RepID=UPI001C3E7211|nr:ATP phosphoribosyltransferase regulatory subunit [Miltoncostaea marina]